MPRLYILRHAKSAWAATGEKDFDRGLSERGSSDLRRIAATMRENGYLPGHVFCSPALRTRITMHGIILAYDNPPRIEYVDRLYSGDVGSYLQCIRGHDDPGDLMVVGHNPSVAELAQQLVADGEAAALDRIGAKFPTGAMAILDFELQSWAELAPQSGYLRHFIVPRDL